MVFSPIPLFVSLPFSLDSHGFVLPVFLVFVSPINSFLFSCWHVFLLFFQVFALFPSPLTYFWLMNLFCSTFLSFPLLPSPILLVLSLLLRRLFHSPAPSFRCLFSFSHPRGLIFYPLPFSPMLWFSHSGDWFLLTLITFGNSSSSTCFFFSCCLLLLLLFFPPMFFCIFVVLFSFHSVFLVLLFFSFSATLFPTFSSLTPASLIIFFHVLWSCLIFFLSLLPRFSSPILFPAHALLCVSSPHSFSLSLSQVLRLRLFAFLLFSIVFLLSLILFF